MSKLYIAEIHKKLKETNKNLYALDGYKVYSQNDEDGIIESIFRDIGIKNKLLVEKRILPNNFVLNKFSKKEAEVIIKLKKRISMNFTLLVNRNFSMFANSLDI